jgi:hypothetical protein
VAVPQVVQQWLQVRNEAGPFRAEEHARRADDRESEVDGDPAAPRLVDQEDRPRKPLREHDRLRLARVQADPQCLHLDSVAGGLLAEPGRSPPELPQDGWWSDDGVVKPGQHVQPLDPV